MKRREFVISGAALTAALRAAAATARKTQNLILVTSDGLRWQDFFTGIDPQLMNEKEAGMGEAAALRNRLWRASPEERRSVLMPFFWQTLAPQGVVLGNVNKGSSVRLTNAYHNSYPGYSELLTGRTQDDVIKGNNPIQNPTPSFLQYLKNRWRLPPEQAAVFASWDVFSFISETSPGEIFVNAGYHESPLPRNSQRVDFINQLQKQALYTEDSARHDVFTFDLAMEYLKSIKPRLLYIALDETDDWAHAKRYDRVLTSIEFLDHALREFSTWLQGDSKYRNTTTLIVTCDHGRGGTLEDWSKHGGVPGDQQIWLAVIGPDTPSRRELKNTTPCFQRDIAPTALEILGVDYREFAGVKGSPIREALAGL